MAINNTVVYFLGDCMMLTINKNEQPFMPVAFAIV